MSSYLGFTLRRKIRRFKRNLNLWNAWFFNYVDRHVFGAWQKLGKMRMTFLSWLFIVVISFWGLNSQISSFETNKYTVNPIKGGIYREALLGQVKSANPLFPENSASEDVISLVFSGLTKINGKREIIPDLAERWDISDDKKTYTFYLRKNVKWHDGETFTAEDVSFTINRLQNPDSRSPLSSNWSGVRYEVVDRFTIKFILPISYGSFLSNTTIGILPKHLLENVKPSNLRIYEFNQKPVGTGPYKLELLEIDKNIVTLNSNEDYYNNPPNIKTIRFYLFNDELSAIDAMVRRRVDGFGQASANNLAILSKIQNVKVNQISLPAYIGLFFNLRSQTMKDIKTRQALALSVDRDEIIKDVLKENAAKLFYPIPAGFVGFNPNTEKIQFNMNSATQLANNDPVRQSKLRLVSLRSPEYEKISEKIASNWRKIGYQVEITTADAQQLQQDFIRSRNYDILLYGQSIGLDSDVYSFWHSSQIDDPGLNISSYKNPEADKLLESGRIAKDSNYKASRYSIFVNIWARDIPAVILYMPFYNYVQSDSIHGFDAKKISEPSDRFYNINQWFINSSK